MAQQLLAEDAQPCVWMCAGLIRYRLCDHDFDCETCPLDAALRGEHHVRWHGVAALHRRAPTGSLPEDRLYTACHMWVQPPPDSAAVWRVGLDAFAAALIGNVNGIAWHDTHQPLHRGEPLCDVDLGLGWLSIGAPLSGRVVRVNTALQQQPDLLLTEPYGTGWIAELTTGDEADIGELLSPENARHRLTLDLRRFRRNVALRLFADAAGRDTRDAPEAAINDLRDLIGGDHYVEGIREFIH